MKACETCGQPIHRQYPGRIQRFCSRSCYYTSGPHGNRVEKTKGPRMKRAPEHPLAPPSGLIAVCRIVLYDKIGPGAHPCRWCGKQVTWMPGSGVAPDALVADHLDWDQNNDSPENIVPSCFACNAHRTRRGNRQIIREDEPVIVASNGTRHRAVERICPTCETTFLARLALVRRGQARFCSPKCRRWVHS